MEPGIVHVYLDEWELEKPYCFPINKSDKAFINPGEAQKEKNFIEKLIKERKIATEHGFSEYILTYTKTIRYITLVSITDLEPYFFLLNKNKIAVAKEKLYKFIVILDTMITKIYYFHHPEFNTFSLEDLEKYGIHYNEKEETFESDSQEKLDYIWNTFRFENAKYESPKWVLKKFNYCHT